MAEDVVIMPLEIEKLSAGLVRELPSGNSWRQASSALSFLSFWAAITLPAIYLPLLLTRIESPEELVVFLGLFFLHVLTLIGGQDYRAST